MRVATCLVLFLKLLHVVEPQSRRVIGDIREQKISNLADIDDREEKVYRRPPTYLILASKIVRPSTIYRLVVSLFEEAVPMRIKASLARDGVQVFGSDEMVEPLESRPILLQVPPGNNVNSDYTLKVEGYSQAGGAMIFQNETKLEFTARFLAIMISTNKVAFTAQHTVKIRAVLLRTDLLPFEDVADLFIIDPDGFIVRKWNSNQLNSGVMTGEFQVPDFPKVGFWTIRVVAQGQVEEKKIKIEKYYIPMFETFVRMPSFHFPTDDNIELTVNHEYTFDKVGFGDCLVRWYAKLIDHSTPLFNDTVYYREEYKYFYKNQNFYRQGLYDTKDGLPVRNISTVQFPDRYGYLDPYVNVTGRPYIPKTYNWTYIRSERYYHRAQDPIYDKVFYISMSEIAARMGTLQGLEVMGEAYMTDFYYNSTQRGWCITRIINKTLELNFLGQKPQVFKPGMQFSTQVSVKYSDQVPLDPETLESSTLIVETRARMKNGGMIDLKPIKIPPKLSDICSSFQDIDLLKHYGQTYGSDASVDSGVGEINPAFFFSDDVEENTEFCLEIFARESSFKEYRETGVYRISVDTPKDAEQLEITAVYRDIDNNREIISRLPVYAAYAPKRNYIHVRTSNRDIKVGEYVVFHVQMSGLLTYFDWVIISKNLIINQGREYAGDIFSHSQTFSIVVSTEMAPGFHILVYTKTSEDYLITDTSYYPVESINRHKIEFSITQLKDHTMKTLEATCRGDPGSVFSISTPRQFLYGAQGANLISKASVLDSLYVFEEKKRHVHRVFWTDREGEAPDKVSYYPSMDYGVDPNRSLSLQELVVFTDFLDIPQTPLTRQCNETAGFYPCMVKGCFTIEQRCDGNLDCDDGYDESNCGDLSRIDQELTYRYRMSRFARYDDFYDNWDGDWGWIDINIDEDHEQFETVEVPETADDWFFTAFSVSKKYGISVLDELVPYGTTRPLWLYCEAPERVKRGETVGIKCTLFNWTPQDTEAVLNLRGSDDYEFVHVEQFGYVVSFNPRTSSGDHHHFIFIRGENNMDIHFPIKPKIDWGTITVVVELSTQMVHQTQEVEIEIIGEGSVVHRHTSVVLDLKNRANELEFMNIIVDETPLIPYEVFRRFVSGSPKGSVTLSGDVIGPTFPDGEPVSLSTMFPTVHGRCSKGTEYHLFNLASNTWLLHYLRLTNQLSDQEIDFSRRIFSQMNVELTAVLRRYSSQGSMKMFDSSGPSVWLTAWSIRILEDVSFQDWEDYIYIDPSIFAHSVMWLINYQSTEGYFVETEYQQVPILKHLNDWGSARNSSENISLTAHVLIALDKVAPALTGDVKKFASRARIRAKRYLEKKVELITDPYEMAITAYALTVISSTEADLAYQKLFSMRLESGGMVYWSRSKIETNRVRYEFNRPFLEAKDYQVDDALAVETTAYALLTLFKLEGGGITFVQDQIVKWLNSMRLGVGGFISTVDTVVALEALVRYSYHNNIKDLTNMFVTVDLPDSNIVDTYHITSEGVSAGIEIPLVNVWGHVNFLAKGAGQAVAQLDLTYGVDFATFVDKPPVQCFDLNLKESFSGRNKSEIAYKTCFKWTCTNESSQSGFAMLVVEIPSGYILLQPDATKIVKSGVIPQLRDSDSTMPGKTVWYFDYIPSFTQCFSHTVRRYFPVANLTRTRQVMIIEPYRPEKFYIKSFNSTSLYILSVCEVCGSYQCPYCPFYSGGGADQLSVPTSLCAMLSIIILLYNAS